MTAMNYLDKKRRFEELLKETQKLEEELEGHTTFKSPDGEDRLLVTETFAGIHFDALVSNRGASVYLDKRTVLDLVNHLNEILANTPKV